MWLSNISVMLRKSYEFEDLLQSSSDSCRVDWYAQSRLGLTRTLSEENVYEDIIGKLDIVTSFARNLVCVDNSCCQLSILYKSPAWFSYTAFSFHELQLQMWLEGQAKPNLGFFFLLSFNTFPCCDAFIKDDTQKPHLPFCLIICSVMTTPSRPCAISRWTIVPLCEVVAEVGYRDWLQQGVRELHSTLAATSARLALLQRFVKCGFCLLAINKLNRIWFNNAITHCRYIELSLSLS